MSVGERSRLGLSRVPYRVRNALEKMAALLRRRQFQWLRNLWKNSPKAWRDLDQFSCTVPYPPTEIVEACRLSDAALNDFREREKGKWFVSFVAVSDEASEANTRCVLRHLHRESGFTHTGPAGEHDDGSAAS